MLSITYHLITHYNEPRILICFGHHREWNQRIKKVSGAKWSSTHKGWHIPDTPENRKKCGFAPAAAVTIQTSKTVIQKIPQAATTRLSASNKAQLLLYMEQLALKKYSSSTLRTYRNEFMQLLHLLGENKVQDLAPEHLKRYMLYCVVKLGLSENTLHSRLNALKFYFEQVLKREKFFWEIPRPKKPLQLPKLLNETELAKLFNSLSNKKHKSMLFTIYSAGLRVSELVNLKIKDIDSKRMQLFIERAKGKKDRYVNLSPVLLDILRNYVKNYSPKPKEYLFESEQTFQAYPVRTVQQIFMNAKLKAGIRKEVGCTACGIALPPICLIKEPILNTLKTCWGILI